MSTVGDLVNRTFREFLTRPDDQPATTTLATTIDAAVTSVEYTAGLLMPEELALIGANTLIEIDRELFLVVDIDTSTNELTTIRAWGGTTAAAHTAGAQIVLAPTYTRSAVFEAVCDSIVDLFPTVWAVATEAVTTTSDVWEMPANTVDVVEFRYQTGGRWYQGNTTLLLNFPDSSTGAALTFPDTLSTGLDGYVTYRKFFSRPSSEATTMTTLGIDTAWERAVIVGAAAQLLAAADVDAATQEFITESLGTTGFPVGSGADVRDGLLRYREYILDRARRRLRNLGPVPLVFNESI